MRTAQQQYMSASAGLTPAEISPGFSSVWKLAWPSITAFALQSAVGLVDLVFVAHLGPEVVAGVGIATQILMAAFSLIAAVTTGTVALVARAIGAGDRAEAERALRASLLLASLLGVVLTCAGSFSEQLVSRFGVDAPVVGLGGRYLSILLLGGVPLALATTFASGLRGAGDVRTPLLVGVVMNAANVVGDYALIFGHLGAPALGADGSAIATVLSFTLGAAVYATLWFRRKLVLDRGRLTEGVDGELCRRILRVGVPTSVEQLFFNLGLFLFLGVISVFGTDAVAAYIIGVRVISFSLIPGMGFQIAASTLVGQHLGARQPERAARSGWGATAGAAVAMSVLGLAIALMARSIAAWFGAVGEPALDLAATFLLIVCAAQPFMALEFGIGGSLKGAGDTRFPLFALLVGLFVFRLGGALLVLHWFGGPIAAIWACLLLDYSIKGALLWLRFQRGHWKTIRV